MLPNNSNDHNQKNNSSEPWQIEVDGQMHFAVSPKTDCPHISETYIHQLDSALSTLKELILSSPCKMCGDKTENWFCMFCENIFCSRYVKEHMLEHNKESGHLVAFSLSDGSFWCYGCESYIINSQLTYLQVKYSSIKFRDQ